MSRTRCIWLQVLMALIVPVASACAQTSVLKNTATSLGQGNEVLHSSEDATNLLGVLPRDARALTRPTPFDGGPTPIALPPAAAQGRTGSLPSSERTPIASASLDTCAGPHGTPLLGLGCLLTI
ncbi:MAG: hypothetical protein JXA69_11695 [Phycisphaerae bacterium]|nr:hypothetical protein [Phycisphaerae bacterium]